jgi:signal transduction histidine kinase
MKDNLHKLAQQYKASLQDYLDNGEEAALQQAYELGRKALAEGLGVLEMVTIHGEALGKVLFGTLRPEESVRVLKAAEFSAESLSPFEMTYRAFQEANVKLRLLSEHLQSVREDERSQIARDIHDELGQALTCLKMDLSWLSNRLSENDSTQVSAPTHFDDAARRSRSRLRNGKKSATQESLLEKTKTMLKFIDGTIQTVRRISAELRPSSLDDLGLSAAIEWQVQEFQTRTGIRCKLTLPSNDITLDQKRSTAMFRIFQETLTNVARHSNATHVTISLQKESDNLSLNVKDNGRGITENEISNSKSLGLVGMRERAFLLGGEVNITGVREKGTTVTVRVPIDETGEPQGELK